MNDQLKAFLLGSGIAQEFIDKVTANMGATKFIVDDGKLVPQYRIQELTQQISEQKALVKQHETSMETLRTSAGASEELKTTIKQLQTSLTTAKTEADAKILREQKSFAVKLALVAEGVGDPGVVTSPIVPIAPVGAA